MTYRVMTVCTGNICRSPMAEIVLRARFAAAGLGDEVVVDSSGTSDEERGNPVDARARRVLVAHGYPAGDGHRARRVRSDDLATHDLVLAMTAAHARTLRRLLRSTEPEVAVGIPTNTDHNLRFDDASVSGGPVVMLRRFDPGAPVVTDPREEHRLDIDDPWYGGPDDFEACLAQIEAAADGVVAHVRAALGR